MLEIKDFFETNKTFRLVDIRPSFAYNYDHIHGAINVPVAQIDDYPFDAKQKYVIYDKDGTVARDVADRLHSHGLDVEYLSGGYFAYLDYYTSSSDPDRLKKIEESIRAKFHKKLFTPFAKAINTYHLIEPGDKIAVCISGGKDSMLMAKLFQELKHHNKFDFELVYLVMDPGYSAANRKMIEENARIMDIPITIFDSNIFDSVYTIPKSPCYICARMRRGYLYSKARELGCNKIALGHHYDDVIETILMGMLYGAQIQTMMPKLHSTNFKGLELIRPMYLIREEDIKAWRDYCDLHFIQCACRFTDNTSEEDSDVESASKRKEMKNLIAKLKLTDPQVDQNIFRSVENVNLSTIIAYKDKSGKKHYFFEDY